MATKIEKVRLVNPHQNKRARKGTARRKCKSRKNPAQLLTLGYLNPQTKGGKGMAKKRKAGGAHKGPRRKNPTFTKAARRSRRRNPQGFSAAGAGSILKGGFFALVGLVVARQIPQMVLGGRNQGVLGYAANIATALLAGMVGRRFLGDDAARYVVIGGGVYVVNRVISENLSPVGRVLSLSGMGDAQALGDIRSGYFPLPVPTNAAGQPIIPQEIRPLPPAPAEGRGVGSVAASTRYGSRF